MRQYQPAIIAGLIAVATVVPGCVSPSANNTPPADNGHFQAMATQIEDPTVPAPMNEQATTTPRPLTIRDLAQTRYHNLSLQEATRLALINSKILVDLGGQVIRAPANLPTAYDVALQETDPQFGPEAALSAFDATFSMSGQFQHNDQQVNNTFVGDNGYFAQSYDVMQAQIEKRAATGSDFTLRQIIDYNRDTNLGDQYTGGNWDTILEAEVRHPLLQGSGIEFNRIAGPGGKPGVYNGVLVARIRTDISLADFEIGLRDYVTNVEDAYWDLYFAYRDLDVKIKARDLALETWRNIKALNESGKLGGEAEKEAQAREQYFRFQEDVQNALAGRPGEATHTYNGTAPGVFRALPGVQVAERRLRMLMGVPISDGELLRPSDEPSLAPVHFDWTRVSTDALTRRAELRRQRWVVKSRELELVAARNYLLPNLDLDSIYRWRGYGKTLIDPDRNDAQNIDNAFASLTSGKYQEWQLGAQFSMPLGFRQGHAAVRNAETAICRARALVCQMERQVILDVSDAVAEVDRAYEVLQTDIDRTAAAKRELDVLTNTVFRQNKPERLFEMLDAQRRYSDALDRYHQSCVEYALAIRNVHFQKGTLLEYCEVSLAEGPWPDKAYHDAARRERLRGAPLSIDYVFRRPPVVSNGPVPPQACIEPPQADPQPSQPATAGVKEIIPLRGYPDSQD
ncbi:MAG: TolC family protein [Thermoguttaceae bacterium]|jgi:outer membrane protein TolC